MALTYSRPVASHFEFVPENTNRFVDDRLGYSYVNLAVHRHLQKRTRFPAELERRDENVGVDGDSAHLTTAIFGTELVDNLVHVFLNLFVGHVSAPLLRFDLVALPETSHEQFLNRLSRKFVRRPVFRARQFLQAWEQFIG
jgi:hypothetical protein